jgi:chromosome segregation protein
VLKRLELVGFKSFADKTQFDFATGITAVVGPNGSGKSNIVDAVRWILGEQSAKSLRGGEMADVIFNGSTTRRSLGLAEVTVTLSNARRQLSIDAEEVQVTRRVYRSGEGEYLINQQLCRLKDIKDMFLGSGAGSSTYCIIEQGRVDVLLQASTKDRRVIFEEAAGISRFKAKKIETLRKLERVDQNLQRLRDIIEEVNKQLRSVKLQAAKAERYKEYSQRLQELRVALGLAEYHELSEKLAAETAVLTELRGELAERTRETESGEAEVRRFDESLAQLDGAIHDEESKLAQAREQIAAADTTLTRERGLAADLEADLARHRSGLTELNARTAALESAAIEAERECTMSDTDCQQQRQRVQGLTDALQNTIVRLNLLARQIQADKTEHLEQMRRAAHFQNEVSSRKAQLESLRRERDRIRQKSDQAAEHLATLDVELQALNEAERNLQDRLAAARQGLMDRAQQRERFRQMSEAAAALASDLRAQRSGLASHIEVLDRLERTHEGLGAGVREVFALLEQPDPGPWSTIVGMVADLLTVPREFAPLIDLALGDAAQRFVVRDVEMLHQALKARQEPFSSRVSFLPLQQARTAPRPQLSEKLPDAQWAVDVVRCGQPELADLLEQLLGNTLIVRDLDTARRLIGQGPGVRFITAQGELLEPDGTVTVGEQHAGTGILSRKSELRELQLQAAELDSRIATTEQDLVGLRKQEEVLETEAASLQDEITVLGEQITDLSARVGQHQERRSGLHLEVETSQSEISGLDQEIASLDRTCTIAQGHADEAERNVQAVQQRLEQADRELHEREVLREQQQQDRESAKVALAQVEERLRALRSKHAQIDADLTQRRQERRQGEEQLAAARTRWEESQRMMLQAQADLAKWYLDKETAQRQATQLSRTRDEQRSQRETLNARLQTTRSTWQAKQQQAHDRELEANSLRLKRDGLADRLREDYQIDLAALYQESLAAHPKGNVADQEGEAPAEPQTIAETSTNGEQAGPCIQTKDGPLPIAQANQEIDELRRKLSRLGNVNLEALQELVELEARAKDLQVQFDDLIASQKSLLEIISQINEDSRKLFTETFASIRGHFQELFRKLFGGGMADIVLEDENDILECGIEIIARPPGKELRSISLMSGGEKTMTAVALLLAIFRSKPSPFCILDEVDAALDEANIGRFTAVLREFLDVSQFILITHSKRTMQMADVLYGITMQESGISKRVAIRFDDWSDEKKNGEPVAAERNGH